MQQPIGFSVEVQRPYDVPNKTIIQGQYVTLIKLTEQHIDDLWACFENIDDSSWTYLWYGDFASKDDFIDFIKNFCLSSDPYFYCVKDNKTDKIVGMLSLMRIDINNGVMEVGHIHFGEELKVTVQATETVFLLIQYAFELGYRRFEWKCDNLNAPSKKSAHRFGFTYEGTFRNHIIYKNRNRDTAWFAIIDTDWQNIKPNYIQWLSQDNFDNSEQQKTKLDVWK